MTFVWLAFFDALLAVTMVAVGVIGAHFYLIPAFMGFQLFALGFLLSILGSSSWPARHLPDAHASNASRAQSGSDGYGD